MADTPVKRRVKNPETFRERALKAAEGKGQPGKLDAVKQAKTKVTTPVATFGQRLWKIKLVRVVATPFRWLGRILLPTYVRESFQELRMVQWPGFKLSLRLTFAVLVFSLAIGAAIAGVDYVLDKAFREILIQ